MTNILQAIATIINHPVPDLLSFYKSKSKNKINAVGDALEEYVKDAFADTIDQTDLSKKVERQSQLFSWMGNQNNPPDLIIKNGDAVEVKKIQSWKSQISLNSSYPKSKLLADSSMITSACRQCEDWREKDIVYVIGVVTQGKLRLLWLIYGDCYAASKEYYERIRTKMISGISEIPEVEFALTKELGRVNKVDPLGITYLRIRGMWGIDNPLKVYSYLKTIYQPEADFQVIAIMRKSKYLSFPLESQEIIESMSNLGLSVNEQQIKSPDNPAKLITAKIITYKM